MKQSRFSEEQILGILKQQEAGRTVVDVCREQGISQATFSAWKATFGGMSVSDARRLRQLEAENAKRRRVVADLTLDNVALKDVLSKKWGRPRPRNRWRATCKNSMVSRRGELRGWSTVPRSRYAQSPISQWTFPCEHACVNTLA